MQLRSEPVELGELSRAVLAEFELGTAERGVGLRAERADGRSGRWRSGSIARILRILLDNAMRVAPRGSEIDGTLRQAPRPSLSVSDEARASWREERS